MKYFTLFALLLFLKVQSFAQAFDQTTVVSNLVNPIAFAIAPNDGRIFVTLKGGIAKVYNSSGTYIKDFCNLSDSTYSSSERGLLGLAFDPNYTTNKFVYFYYNHLWPFNGSTGNQAIRVIRFTDNNNTGTNPTVILHIPVSNSIGGSHVGGNIHFRPSDANTLYIAIGELGTTSYAQTLVNPFGKILRINKNGTIPSTNPFYDDGNPGTGNDDRIWEYGHRNPFEFTFSTVNDSLYVAENGLNTQDEVNLGRRGGNFGWPACEGNNKLGSANPCNTPGLIDPITVWQPTPAITGILFYSGCMFPEWKNHLLVGDYLNGNLYNVTLGNAPAYNSVTSNTTIADITSGGITSIKQGSDGSIYVLNGGVTSSGRLYRLSRTISPVITAGGPTVFCQGGAVVLSTTPVGYDYQWRINGTPIDGATSGNYTAKITGNFSVAVCNNISNSIKVARKPISPAKITANGSTDICQGGSVTLLANAGASLVYQWRLNNKRIGGATNMTYAAKKAGSYRVLETNTQNGCSKQSGEIMVNIVCRTEGETAYLPYPNPFTGNFTLNLLEGEMASVEMFGLDGRRILFVPETSGALQLGNELPAGIYILSVKYAGGDFSRYKMVKME